MKNMKQKDCDVQTRTKLKYPRPGTSKYDTNKIKTYLTEDELDFLYNGAKVVAKMGAYLMAVTVMSLAISIVLLNLSGGEFIEI